MVLNWKKIFDHPAFPITCFVLATISAFVWLRSDLSLIAPGVPGYSWNDHPQTMLVYFNGATGCACAADLVNSAKQVLNASADVVIVGKPGRISELDVGSLKTNPHFKIIATDNLKSPEPIAEGQSRLYCVRNGRILKKAYGTVVPAIFLTKEGLGR